MPGVATAADHDHVVRDADYGDNDDADSSDDALDDGCTA